MDLGERVIPPLRSDVVLEETGEEKMPAAAVDRTLGQRIKLDPRGAMLASGLTRSWKAADLLGALHGAGLRLTPELLVRFIRFFDGHLLLASERAERRIAAIREADQASAERPVTFLAGTSHDCVACSESCGGHDVGPIAVGQVQAIQEAIPGARFLERKTGSEDTSGHYCAMEQDRCTFLREDRLCSIHAVFGVEKKPTDCRIFPLAFTSTPDGIVAGVRLECRSYLASKRGGGALAERQAELALLSGAADSLSEVPPLVRIDGAITLPWSEYRVLEAELIEVVDAMPVVWDGLRNLNSLARERIEAIREADRLGQVFPLPPDPTPGVEMVAVVEALERGCAMAGRMNAAAGNVKRAERHQRVGRAAARLRTTPLARPELSADDDELLRDHLKQTLFVKDPITGPHLRFGLGLLNLSVLLAIAALEETRDLNAALAESLKALRSGPVRGPLHEIDGAVAAWLHSKLEAWIAH